MDKLEKQFEELWKLYPRKQGKKRSQILYSNLLKSYSHDDIVKAVNNFIEDMQGRDKKYISQGSSFFSHRYLDYLPENYVKEEIKEVPKKQEVKIYVEVKGYEEYLQKMMSMPYNEYLLTDHWVHFRKETLKFFGHKCSLCNAKDKELHVHHKTYENRGRETFNDVVVLCSDCHELVHNE